MMTSTPFETAASQSKGFSLAGCLWEIESKKNGDQRKSPNQRVNKNAHNTGQCDADNTSSPGVVKVKNGTHINFSHYHLPIFYLWLLLLSNVRNTNYEYRCEHNRNGQALQDGSHMDGSNHIGDTEFLESIKKGSTNATLSENAGDYQPLGSMPRCCSSLRMIRLIQAAKDSSPSIRCASSIISLSSGSNLNWNGGLPRLSFVCVDTSITPKVMCLCVMTHYIRNLEKATPRSAGTLPRRLTTNVISSNEAAMKNHTTHPQGRNAHTLNSGAEHPSFIWLIAAVRRDMPTIKPILYHILAESEQEARRTLARDHICFFAGRIRQEVVA